MDWETLAADHGPVRALAMIEAARGACLALAADYESRGWHGAAQGQRATACALLCDARNLVEVHA